jgi:hypothetical protein
MNRLEASTRCVICGHRKAANEIWFSVTEDCELDRVIVWLWTRRFSRDPRSHPVCSHGHARELIVHWMATGCLHYPFATDPRPSQRLVSSAGACSATAEWGQWLAELSVDRGSVQRILAENPYSLNLIFEELMIALGAKCEDEEPETFLEPGALVGRS